ncbi:TOBE domain-containing protein [Lamprobacter modestohalophilus]|jgi:molybdate transport system regulatory protein|uniref:Transporter n=1 Tax=Lamprobacter modestohalophilus TaxID=1064514 RepID=A0A9X1B4E6_9GAMM|nr:MULTISPECIES: TOBE domain-containing protein [Chromatiaceae]MBK1618959.1 transporter [Lamprobacter modestohalophilus]MBK5941762.1 transporter [Halochromatium roseum]MCF7976740.1 TOBE domain-containing protein [Chromatiaceae bacterium]MEA1049626.1 TOBE domain-containing protein [Lamprobacter modestohalophilus]
MKISARNQFRGKVAEVTLGAVNAEVLVTLTGGEQIVAIVTNESVKSLNLKAGSDVIALIKASSVLVMTDDAGIRLSARNSLKGKVTALEKGPIHAEVCISLASGDSVHATITHAACDVLGLAEGVDATAVIKAPQVILGVPT